MMVSDELNYQLELEMEKKGTLVQAGYKKGYINGDIAINGWFIS